MKRGKRHGIYILSFFICAKASIAQEIKPYTVHLNDRLSVVLLKSGPLPLYGLNGSLEKVLELNPSLRKRKGNLILPGQIILIPYREKKEVRQSKLHINDKAKGSLNFYTGTGFLRSKTIDQKDINGITDTESLVKTELVFRQYWNERVIITYMVGIYMIKLADSKEETHSRGDFNIPIFAVSSLKKISPKHGLFFEVRTDPLVYIRNREENVLKTAAGQIVTFVGGWRMELARRNELSSHFQLSALGIPHQAIGGFRFGTGRGYAASLLNSYEIKEWILEGNLVHSFKEIPVSMGKIQQTEYGMKIGIGRVF